MIKVRDLTVTYTTREGKVRALDNVSFDIPDKIIFGMVGESGSGKSTFAMALMGLLPKNSKVEEGSIEVDGVDVLKLTPSEYRKVRGAEIALVFQGAMNTLNPLIKIEDQVGETLVLHKIMDKMEAVKKARETLSLVGLDEQTWTKYPHELSGGMKQRAVIATAMVSNPKIIIADEPSTALDVITQVQIMNLLRQLQKEFNATIILISHDFPLVSEMADSILVLYGGKICELGKNSKVLGKPKHPYTAGLINSIPTVGKKKELRAIRGEPVNLRDPPTGCRFRERCDFSTPACESYVYKENKLDSDQIVYCNLYG